MTPQQLYVWENIIPEPNSGCWLWLQHLDKHGYGRVRVAPGENHFRMAQGFSWEAWNGPIPNGLLMLHRCDLPCCVNPDHLFPGTHQDNSDDMKRKGRQNKYTGEDHPQARINEAMVREIRARYRDGEGSRDLAIEFGIVQAHLTRIATGKKWAHVK